MASDSGKVRRPRPPRVARAARTTAPELERPSDATPAPPAQGRTATSVALVQGLQRTYGNAAVSQFLQRDPVAVDPVAKQRDDALKDQHLLGGLEVWLSTTRGISSTEIDWVAEIPRLRNAPQPEPETLVQASDLDRYVMFLDMLQADAAGRGAVTGTVAQNVGKLGGAVEDYLFKVLPPKSFAHDAPRVYSEKFLSHWLTELNQLKFVPDGFDVTRFKPVGAYAAEARRGRLEDVLMNRDAPQMMIRYVLGEWYTSQADPETWLRQLDLAKYRTRLVKHLTSEVMRRAKSDPFYVDVLRDAGIEESRYETLVGFLGYARRFDSRSADVARKLWQTPIEDLDEPELEVADNPYAFYEQSRKLANATYTMLAGLEPNRSPEPALVEGVASILAALDLPPGLAGFMLVADLGSSILKIRELNQQQEAAAEKRINGDVEVHFDEIASVVRHHADFAADFISKTWIPVLKRVALERVKHNRDELQKSYLNWDAESDEVSGRLLLKAIELDELVRIYHSGQSISIGGEVLTDDDIDRMKTMATFYHDESAARLDPVQSKKRREQLKESIEGYDGVAEGITSGRYSPLDYSGAIYAEARQRLGIGEFPEGTTVYGAIFGGMAANREPFLASAIVEWKWREDAERAAVEFLKLAGQLLLTATTITLGLLLGPVGFVKLLGWIDAGWNLLQSHQAVVEAEDVLAMAKLDPQGTVRGVAVEDAEKALTGARHGFYLAVALVVAPHVLRVGGKLVGEAVRSIKGPPVLASMTNLTALVKSDVRLARKLMLVVKDNQRLEELLHFAGSAGQVEKLLARSTDAKQLVYLLMHYKSTPRLLALLDKATSASQLTKLLDAVGGDVYRLGRLTDKVDRLFVLENALDALGGNARRVESVVLGMRDNAQLTRLLAAVDGKALRLEGLLKLAKPDELERLITISGVAKLEDFRNLGVGVAVTPALLEKSASAAQVAKLLKAVGGNANLERLLAKVSHLNVLERMLADLGGDVGRAERLLDAVPDAAQLERLLAVVDRNAARLEGLLKMGTPVELEGLLKLVSARQLEQLHGFGLTAGETSSLLGVLSPQALAELEGSVGGTLLKHLAKKSPETIKQLERALELAGADAVARGEIVKMVEWNARGILSNSELEGALTDLRGFMERYHGRVSGDFASRFRGKYRLARPGSEGGPQVLAEIRLAEDMLEGRTALGDIRTLEGLPTRDLDELQVPEYRGGAAGGSHHLAEIKALTGRPGLPIGKNTVRRNAGKAISQLRTQFSETGEREGLIRLDGRDAGPMGKTAEEIRREINGELQEARPDPKGVQHKGVDFVRWVEVFYNTEAKQQVHLVLEVRAGTLVIASGAP